MKNTKGFTLIELLVVVAIIGVLSVIGLRLYNVQQDKAKNAIVKANTGGIQTAIQTNFTDKNYQQESSAERIAAILSDIPDAVGCRNPYTGGTGNVNLIKVSGDSLSDGEDIDFGKVAIASPDKNAFLVQGLDQDGKLFGNVMQAKK